MAMTSNAVPCGKHGTMPTCLLGCSTVFGCALAGDQPCLTLEPLRRRRRRRRSVLLLLLILHRLLLPLQVLLLHSAAQKQHGLVHSLSSDLLPEKASCDHSIGAAANT